MIIDAIREYFLDCPILDEMARLDIDYLDNNTTSYSIDSLPSEMIIKKYVDGTSLRQFQFVIASRENYGLDTWQQLENRGFYEKLAEWIELQSSKGLLPNLTDNKESQDIEILTSGYLFDVDDTTARYQIQLRLIYFQDL